MAPNSRNSGRGSAGSNRKGIANEDRLVALGQAVDRRQGIERPRRHAKPSSRSRRNWLIAGIAAVMAVVVVVGGGYIYAQWRFSQIHKITVSGEAQALSGQPINILSIGSDSRTGLSGFLAAQTGATVGGVAGQRSDVVKIIHVDPTAGTISIVSIPRDTMTTLLANQSLYGKFNRINVNFGSGPSLVAQTLTANFGIPINHTIVVSFAGLMNAAIAVGGVHLRFPYTSHDPYSGLRVTHPGCQLVTGFEALALARSRHFYYSPTDKQWPVGGNHLSDSQLLADGWYYDGTSDFGRIKRQDAFLNALINRAKTIYNPLTLNALLSKIPEGISLDSNFGLNELIGLALKFHHLQPGAIRYYTIPTVSGVAPGFGDVLFVNQPAAQQMLVQVFGSQLQAPTNPPPNAQLQTPMPPVVTIPPSTTTTTVKGTKKTTTVTTSTVPQDINSSFNPSPC
jgi:LCP family protein required for cell wall assembly